MVVCALSRPTADVPWNGSRARKTPMAEDPQQKVLQEFRSKGYGYADYTPQSGFVSRSLLMSECVSWRRKSAGGKKRCSWSTVGTTIRTDTLSRLRCRPRESEQNTDAERVIIFGVTGIGRPRLVALS